MYPLLSKLFPILLLVLLEHVRDSVSGKKCTKAGGPESLNYLATKRHYFYNEKEASKSTYTPNGCVPIKFWYFGRHGTRNPGKKDIVLMQTLLPNLHQEVMEALNAGKGTLCPEARTVFESWKPRADLTVAEASYLVAQGQAELKQIGFRYKARFPTLFPTQFSNNSYLFKHTDSQRTAASARSFAAGIFGDEEVKNVYMPAALEIDPVLKFYDSCPKYIKEVDENPKANKEHDKFVLSGVMNRTIKNASNRLGLDRSLSLEDLTLVYTTCGFETAWQNGTVSPWCLAFDKKDFNVMAFREDLEYYWKDGYGYKINFKQACPPFADATKYFESDTQRKVQAYFSHSGATLKMLARLGLFKSDDEMKADKYKDDKDYVWRTSRLDPMATNLAFTLFQCRKKGKVEKKIGFYFQEIPQEFKACDDEVFCSYDEFRAGIDFIDECNLDGICKITS